MDPNIQKWDVHLVQVRQVWQNITATFYSTKDSHLFSLLALCTVAYPGAEILGGQGVLWHPHFLRTLPAASFGIRLVCFDLLLCTKMIY